MRQANAAVFTILSLIGLGLVFVVVRWMLGWDGHVDTAREPGYVTWSAFVAVSVVIYVHVFARTVRHLRVPSRTAGIVAGIAYGILALLVVATLTNKAPEGTLPTVPRVMVGLYLVALVCAAPAVLTLWLASARLDQIGLHAQGALDRLLTIRVDIGRSLTGLSLIVSTGLINTAALRKAHLAHGLKPELFPPTLVLAYGAGLTGIVALIYIPAFLAWRDRAMAMVNAVYPVPKDARPTEQWAGGRARLTELISPDVTVGKTVSAALGILAPLATSLLALSIPELKPK